MEGEEPLPEDLRCKRTDGRDWRCKRRVVDGKSFCENHLYRGQKKRPFSPKPNLHPNPDTDPKPTPRLRIRVRVKPEPVEEVPQRVSAPDQPASVPVSVPDNLRCNRNDGRSWRCKRQVVEGQLFCEMHCPQKRLRARMLEGENGNRSLTPAPERRRCARNNGKDWRCKRQAVEGHSFCEVHLNRVKNKEKEKQTPPAENDEFSPVPENLRCTRNDGREWRCKSRVMEGQILCESHFKRLKNKGSAAEGMERKKIEPSPKKRRRIFPPVPGNLRCSLIDGRGRCQRRAIEGETLCEVHLKRAEKSQSKSKKLNVAIKPEPETEAEPMPGPVPEPEAVPEPVPQPELVPEPVKEKENAKGKEKQKEKEKDKLKEKEKEKEKERGNALPEGEGDDLRCKRTDGRGWRCKMRVLEGKTLCEIHYEQGRLRQMKVSVPEALKIKRGDGGGEKIEKRLKKKRELEVLENSSDKGMKRMKADLIRVFLRREIIERSKKSEKGSENSGEVTRDLPYGLMAIPPAPPTQFLDNAESLGIKVGVQCYKPTVNRRFRSKNIEPPPISSLKVVPYVGDLGKVKNTGRRKCHWCRHSENKSLTKCLTCRKRFFCSDCMKERCSDPKEVKLRCPVCRGSCDCKFCRASKSKDVGTKEILKEQYTGSKLQQLQYLTNFLLPILEQINQVQSAEVEMEAKFKGQNPSEVDIRQADVGCSDSCCCNNCKSPILDFHRSCPNCSYNLCLSCCQEYSQGGLLGGNGSFPNRGKTHLSGLMTCSEKIQKSSSAQSTDNADLAASSSIAISTSVHISCPPMELGGCDNSFLDLRCIFPLNWTKELEISAKEMVSECDFLRTRDDSVQCSLCAGFSEADKSKELQEASRRKGSEDNFLYCPGISDHHDIVLAHFQKHWQKGHPVKVHNVLHDASSLSWDPLAMFSCYLEKVTSNCENVKEVQTANCSDWYDVEIGVKESFIGSLGKGCTRTRRETLKLKAKLSSALSRTLFESHLVGIIHALPFQEYTNPRTGLLNLAGKLPEDFPDSKLGPHICILCGSGEEIARGELVTNLCYNSFDVVNILVHAGDSPCSTELLSKIKKLLRRNDTKDKEVHPLPNSESGEAKMQGQILVEAGGQDRVLDRNSLSQGVTGSCSVAANDTSGANLRDDTKSPAKVHGSDTDSDASMICSGARDSPEKSTDQMSHLDRMESTNLSDKRHLLDNCGAQWDVFRRQDIPKLVEYITKHVDEFNYGCGLPKDVIHPIFDGNFYLDTTHKLRLKEEFEIEPWTFNQHMGEAVFIPAGCPYQMRAIKSCVNVVAGFVSPENVSECIKLMDEIRLLPNDHRAKQERLEVEKMTICSMDEAIKEMYRLKSEVRSQPSLP